MEVIIVGIDGWVEGANEKAFSQATTIVEFSQEDLTMLMATGDKNKDCVIDCNEFLSWVFGEEAAEDKVDEATQKFRKADEDAMAIWYDEDFIVNEFLSWVNGKKAAEDKVQHIVDEAMQKMRKSDEDAMAKVFKLGQKYGRE